MRYTLLLFATGCIPLFMSSRHLREVHVDGLPQSSLQLETSRRPGSVLTTLSVGWSSGDCYELDSDVRVTAGGQLPSMSRTDPTYWTTARHASPLQEETCTNRAEWTFAHGRPDANSPREFRIADATKTLALTVGDPFAVDCQFSSGESAVARPGDLVQVVCVGDVALREATVLPDAHRSEWKRADVEHGSFRVPSNVATGRAIVQLSGTQKVHTCVGAMACSASFMRTLNFDVRAP